MAKKKYSSKAAATKAAKKTTKKYKQDKVGEVAPQTLVDLTVLAKWTCKLSNIDHFDFDWEYLTASGIWVQGGNGTSSVPPSSYADGYYQTTFTAPSDPTVSKVRYRTKAVAKKHNVTKKYTVKTKITSGKNKGKYKTETKTVTESVPYWTAQWSSYQEMTAPAAAAAAAERVRKPDTPNAPSATRNADGTITVTWTAQTDPATHLWLYRCQDGDWVWTSRKEVATWLAASSTTFVDKSAAAGHAYEYVLIAYNQNGERWSDPSSFSGDVAMQPEAPMQLRAAAVSSTSVRLDWLDTGYTGDGYTIEYTTNASAWADHAYEDISTVDYESTPSGGANHYTVTNLDSGATWYFRVIRTEGSLESLRSEMASAVIGTVPTAPTLAGTLSAYYKGESVAMAWTHNCEDGSEQSHRHLVVKTKAPDEAAYTTVVDDSSATSATSYVFDTSELVDGTEVAWAVRTQGILTGADDWSPWSETMSFKVWVKPTLTVVLTQKSTGDPVSTEDPLTALPVVITLSTGANATSQSAIEWTWKIVSQEAYGFVGDDGEDDYIAAGTEIASGYIDANDPDFSSVEQEIEVGAEDAAFMHGIEYAVSAEALMDSGLKAEEATASFSCEWDDDLPVPTATLDIAADYTSRIYPACYEIDEETGEAGELAEGVTLSVYRINSDNTLVQLASGLPNTGTAVVCDPHPNFGECWYRVCANSTATDAVTVFDEMLEVPYDFVLIQWDERTVFKATEQELDMSSSKYIELPYNIDMKESYAPDVALAEYIGREHPVSYYGTQKGQSASWSVSVERDGADIPMLRQLAAWPGDCYVREPSGTGYWAYVAVSGISQSVKSGIADISIEVTQVEGDEEAVVA